METVYLVCAAVGTTVLVVQTVLLVLGLGGDHLDVDGHVDMDGHLDVDGVDGADIAFKVLSFKTLIAFLAFFGLAGLAGGSRGWAPATVLSAALGAGAVAVLVVGYLMAGLAKLQSTGNLDLRNAMGQTGRVYLRIPAEQGGQGKVTLQVQGRRLECKAVTRGPEIPTGAEVTVVATPSHDTVEVQPLA